jgi:hypothetical protein
MMVSGCTTRTASNGLLEPPLGDVQGVAEVLEPLLDRAVPSTDDRLQQLARFGFGTAE